MASDALKLTSCTTEEDLPQSPRKGIETRAIVACGGKYTFCYLPEKDQWKRLVDGLDNGSCYSKMIQFRDQLYTFRNRKLERYDPVFDCWSTLNSEPNDYGIMTVLKGDIYALKVDTHAKKSTITRYDVDRCSWQTVLLSPEGCRADSCIVSAGNHLYVFGGTSPQLLRTVTKAERFDTVENQWESIADMQEKRNGAFGVATQGKIFVAGGTQAKFQLPPLVLSTTCEMYNISTNEWQFIGSLNIGRVSGSMVCVKGTLYVLGGREENFQGELSIECYDPTENKWSMKTILLVKTISKNNDDTFAGCALKVSKGVLDKTPIVKV